MYLRAIMKLILLMKKLLDNNNCNLISHCTQCAGDFSHSRTQKKQFIPTLRSWSCAACHLILGVTPFSKNVLLKMKVLQTNCKAGTLDPGGAVVIDARRFCVVLWLSPTVPRDGCGQVNWRFLIERSEWPIYTGDLSRVYSASHPMSAGIDSWDCVLSSSLASAIPPRGILPNKHYRHFRVYTQRKNSCHTI